MVERIGLLGLERNPIDAVLGEQIAPFLEAAFVEQTRLAIEEALDVARLGPVDFERGVGAHSAASRASSASM